jgi:hypothetical protein
MGFEELPLVLFTVFTQIAIGLALVSAVQQWAIAGGPTDNQIAAGMGYARWPCWPLACCFFLSPGPSAGRNTDAGQPWVGLA